jgi:hypothetical protein
MARHLDLAPISHLTVPATPIGHSELEQLHLSQKQLKRILAFLKTLDSPINAPPQWLITSK